MKLRYFERGCSVLLTALACAPSQAAEHGLDRALTGAQGYELTMPLYPGLYVDAWTQDYRSTHLRDNSGNSASTQVTVPQVGTVPIAIKSKTQVNLLIANLLWLTEQTFAEGRLGLTLSLSEARVDNRLDFSSNVPALASTLQQTSAHASGKKTGMGDAEFAGFLDWQNDAGRISAGLSLHAPTGQYDKNNAVNAGFGDFWTIRPFIINSRVFQNGIQIGAFTTYNINTKNKATNYRSGDFIHSDLMALFPLNDWWRIGAEGFVLKQVTDDSNVDGRVRDNRAQALGFGPSIAYVSDSDWGVDLKVMKEFAVRNRTEGVVTWLRLHMRLN